MASSSSLMVSVNRSVTAALGSRGAAMPCKDSPAAKSHSIFLSLRMLMTVQASVSSGSAVRS